MAPGEAWKRRQEPILTITLGPLRSQRAPGLHPKRFRKRGPRVARTPGLSGSGSDRRRERVAMSRGMMDHLPTSHRGFAVRTTKVSGLRHTTRVALFLTSAIAMSSAGLGGDGPTA